MDKSGLKNIKTTSVVKTASDKMRIRDNEKRIMALEKRLAKLEKNVKG